LKGFFGSQTTLSNGLFAESEKHNGHASKSMLSVLGTTCCKIAMRQATSRICHRATFAGNLLKWTVHTPNTAPAPKLVAGEFRPEPAPILRQRMAAQHVLATLPELATLKTVRQLTAVSPITAPAPRLAVLEFRPEHVTNQRLNMAASLVLATLLRPATYASVLGCSSRQRMN